MKLHKLLILACYVIVAVPNIRLRAQESQPTSTTETISVSDPRPVAAALEQLERKHQLAITYEDPEYVYTLDMQDVTDQVAKRPTLDGHRILIPKGGPLQFQYAAVGANPREDVTALIVRLVAGYSSLSNLGNPVFGVQGRVTSQNRKEWNVIPLKVRNQEGELVTQTPLLDNFVTIPQETRSASDMMREICQQLSQISGHRVGIGTVPTNALLHYKGDFGATNQRARDVLADTLDKVEPNMVWQLFYDPGLGWFVLNIHFVEVPGSTPLPTTTVGPPPPGPNSNWPGPPGSGPLPVVMILHRPNTPEAITAIQSALARTGYYQGSSTGVWDANTTAAMQKFQTASGHEPTGKPDPRSIQDLAAAYNSTLSKPQQ